MAGAPPPIGEVAATVAAMVAARAGDQVQFPSKAPVQEGNYASVTLWVTAMPHSSSNDTKALGGSIPGSSVRFQSLARGPVTTGYRPVDGTQISVALGGFAGKEERPCHWRPELGLSSQPPNGDVAVGPATERVCYPVVIVRLAQV